MRASVLRQILLMIFLRAIEGRRGFDLGHDWTTKTFALFELGQLSFSSGFLFRRVIENNRPVLRANIGSLTIARGRIVVAPKDVKQLSVGNLRRIKDHFDYFRMARFIATNIFIGRIFCSSASIAHGGIFYSLDLPKGRFDAPKTSGTEGRFFSVHRFTIKREANRRKPLGLTTTRGEH